MQTTKQKKVAGVIREALSEIFQRENLFMVGGGMVTISDVTISPDLLIARIYLSLYQVKNPAEFMKSLEQHGSELRHRLGNKIRNQVRRIPELHFHLDETMDHVFRLEEIFKQIKKE